MGNPPAKLPTRYISELSRQFLVTFTIAWRISFRKLSLASAHEVHLRLLLCEIYKTIHCINPIFMQNIFHPKEVLYELRISNLLHLPRVKSVLHGTSCFAFRGRLLWNQLPDTLKTAPSLTAIKKALVTYKIQGICKCSTCK